jgi:trigger factor
MKYTTAPAEKSTVKVTITFTASEWNQAIDKAYVKTRGKYTVPGFRKGKAPKPVLENYYGKGVFFEEALNTLYAENYPVILEKEKDNFTAVGDPSLDVENLSEEEVVLTAVIPVKPEVTIEKYTGLKIKKFEYNVTDSDVEEEVNKLLARNATTVEVTDRACKLTDVVNIDFSGTVDGVKFPGGTAEGYDLELGSGSFIPGFEDQVVGMQIGEEKDINVTFPETYQAEDLKGKNAVFAIKLNKITGKELPELTDEFVKKHAGSETVADYKEKTKARLERDAERRSTDETENSIIGEISKYAQAEIPDAMIESEVDRMVQDFSYRLMYQGIKLEDYLTYIGQKMEDFRAQFKDQAKSRVLSQLIVDKIVKEQGLKASQEEIDEKIAEQAKSVEKTAEEYKKTMDPKQVEYIASDIVVTKLFDYLKENNELFAE